MQSAFRAKVTKTDEKNSEDIGVPGFPYPDSYANPPIEPPFSSTQQIPFRGAEPHSVAYTENTYPNPLEPYTPGEEQKANTVINYSDHDYEPAPIPVSVVSSPPPITVRKRYTTSTIVIPAGTVLPVRVAPFRANRTKLRISVKKVIGAGAGPDRIWLSNDEQFTSNNGWPFDSGDPFFESNTTDDMWVALDTSNSNGAMVLVYSEWEIEALTKAEQGHDKQPHKSHKHG